MARTVADIATILDATVGYDPADPVTAASRGQIPRTYTSSLKRDALKRARIGVLSQFFGEAPEDQEVGTIVRRAIEDMKAAGATAVDVAVPDLAAQLMASNLLIQELKFYLGRTSRRRSVLPSSRSRSSLRLAFIPRSCRHSLKVPTRCRTIT